MWTALPVRESHPPSPCTPATQTAEVRVGACGCVFGVMSGCPGIDHRDADWEETGRT